MNISRHWKILSAAAAITLGFSSCAYDPYYSSGSGYYSSGYGDGYGYGGRGFSTSLFVSTGDPRWGYDPHTYCYYDYRSRRYYDPYLYGYYPVGYRPPIMIGVPHPYGWRPGRGYCPPPRTVRNVTVVNYRNREAAYRNSNYSWGRQVRSRPDSQARGQRQNRNDAAPYAAPSRYNPNAPSTRSSSRVQQPSERVSPTRDRRYTQPQRAPQNTRQSRSDRRSSTYNAPVTDASPRRAPSAQRQSAERIRTRESAQPSFQGRTRNSENRVAPSRNRVAPTENRAAPSGNRVAPTENRAAPSGNRRSGNQDTPEQPGTNERSKRTLRSLGEG